MVQLLQDVSVLAGLRKISQMSHSSVLNRLGCLYHYSDIGGMLG